MIDEEVSVTEAVHMRSLNWSSNDALRPCPNASGLSPITQEEMSKAPRRPSM